MKPVLSKGSKNDDVKLLQGKLNALGIDAGLVDGIFGLATLRAVKELQFIFSLKVDGIVGSQSWSLLDKLDTVKNFKLDEFRCRHCKTLKLNVNLLLKLEELRSALGDKPMVINSGYRCPTHNASVGGIKNSEHLKGNAADIKVIGMHPFDVHKIADRMFAGGVGKYNTFTHVDVGVNRYRWDNSTIDYPVGGVSKIKKIRKYNTNIHVYETSLNELVKFDLGVRKKLERVSSIVKNKVNSGDKVALGINGGFFNFDGSSEHLGLFISEGLYFSPPNPDFMEFIFFKDGHTNIVNYTAYDRAELSKLQKIAHWAVSTSYSLVINGKIDIRNGEKFSHSTERHPRTMIGQKANGNFILAVTDGRVGNSKGLTAKEQAQIMLDLDCFNAGNLDGGGSSTMVEVVDGKVVVVNKLKDGYERPVGSVMLVWEG